MKWLVQVAGLVAVLVMASLPVHAQAIASVFSIVSPPDGEAVPVGSQPPQIAIDAAGRIMVAYKFKGADGKILPYSALRIGDTWQHAAIPIPQLSAYPSSLTLRGLVGGASGQGFHLVGTHYGTIFYWHWQNGVWSAPETVPPRTSTGGLSAAGIALKPTGEPIVVWSHTRFEYMQKVNGQWQTAKLLPEIAQRSIPPIYANPSGAIHLLGIKRYNPLVTSLPASADPLVDSNWVSTPTSDPKSWTSVLGSGAVELELALDWPHQLVFAAWESKKHLYVGWAPIGATSEGQWRTADIPLPERVGHIDHCLVSNGRGGVGLLVCAYDPSEPVLTFHWLSGAGPGPQIPILRPGTDTEASVFKSVPMGTRTCALTLRAPPTSRW